MAVVPLPPLPAVRLGQSCTTFWSTATSPAAMLRGTVITLAVDDWLLERLLTFDAGAEDHEDNGDGEPDNDAEVDGPPSSH